MRVLVSSHEMLTFSRLLEACVRSINRDANTRSYNFPFSLAAVVSSTLPARSSVKSCASLNRNVEFG